jgi:predicted transcriptional regulator
MNVYNARIFKEQHKENNPEKWRVCDVCNQEKNLSHFSLLDKTRKTTTERKSTCKKCSASIRQTEKLNRDWKVDAAKLLYKNIKSRCKRTGREFSIDLEDISIPEKCPVFGFDLKREDKKTWMCAPSVDRIDSSKGYIKGNVTVVSRRANILKRDATVEELELLLNYYKTLRN